MKKARILIVEDEELVALGIRLFLQSLGYEVLPLLSTGEEVVARFEELSADLVLMDIRLAGPMTGIEAAGMLRERFQIPIVFLTAYSDPDTMRGARLSSPYGYILKPFDEQALAATIAVALRKADLHRDMRASAEGQTAPRESARGGQGSSAAGPPRPRLWRPAATEVQIGAFRMGGFLIPSTFGAADRFEFFRIDDSHLGLFTADVLDYGGAAASRALLLEDLLEVRSGRILASDVDPLVPRLVAEEVNDRLCAAGGKAFVALSYGVIDQNTRNLRLVVAGYPAPILQRSGGSIQEIPCQGFAAGVTSQFRVFEQEVGLAASDRLFFYSDGLADCADAPLADASEGRLRSVLQNCHQRDLMEAIACIRGDVLAWQDGRAPQDDISLMAIQAG